jgi:hypothetical protein
MDPRNAEMISEIIAPLKEAARERVRAFAEEPLGRFIKIAGNRMMACHAQGRQVNLEDLQAIIDEAVEVDRQKKGSEK